MVPLEYRRINYYQFMRDDQPARVDQWPPYEVICAQFDDLGTAQGHRHLRSVDTRDQDGGLTRWNVPDLTTALRDKERFVVSGSDATLAVGLCPACPFMTLKFDPPEAFVPACE